MDALLGTGARGPVEGLLARSHRRREPPRSVSDRLRRGHSLRTTSRHRRSPRPGRPPPTTRSLSPRRKSGCLNWPVAILSANLSCCDIGSPPELIEEVGQGDSALARAARIRRISLCPANPSGNKGDYGHALIVAGCLGKSGAAVLPRGRPCA